MFTGIIDNVGTLVRVSDSPAGRELVIESSYADLEIGESVACDGVCLTVRTASGGRYEVAAVATTCERTTIESWRPGRRINLERAVTPATRLGGHIVQGHVDAVGEVTGRRQSGSAVLVDIAAPPEVHRLLVEHGSVAVDGVSLTVNALDPDGCFQISLIDHTLRNTTLDEHQPGRKVNLEADLIARYVDRLLAARLPARTDR
ncbi:MAG: riboflavin synthase [Gemmatimonadota bacterium]